jgi:hypothetical protein
MVTTPFSLRIFVADGDPDGLRIVDKSNWIGKALVFSRALLPQVKARPELAQTGVYLLLGPRPDGEGNILYVGEGDPIRSGLGLRATMRKKIFGPAPLISPPPLPGSSTRRMCSFWDCA